MKQRSKEESLNISGRAREIYLENNKKDGTMIWSEALDLAEKEFRTKKDQSGAVTPERSNKIKIF